jgi:hypothetical protein
MFRHGPVEEWMSGVRMGARWRVLVAGVGGVLLVALGACYPGGVTDIEDGDLVLTVFDTAADFSALRSYFMPDSVIRVAGGDDDAPQDDTTREFDEAIVSEVETQLSALGYRRIDDPAEGSPDAVVLLSVNTTELAVWAPVCWYCGWGWYPWGPDWGWGWGPGYTPGYPVPIGRRTVGTLVVTLMDPVAPGTDLPVHWAGAANGLLSRDSDADLARVQQAIGQMFVQSPYLGAGGEG